MDSLTAMQVIPVATILAKLGAMLTLSLLIERFLVVLNWAMNKLFLVKTAADWDVPEKKQAEMEQAVRAKKEADILAESPKESSEPADPREVVPHPDYGEPESRFDIIRLTSKNQIAHTKEFWSQVVGTFVAIAVCYYADFSAWSFVASLENISGGSFSFTDYDPQWWEFVLTGVIIGSGSKPVHFLMNFVISRKFHITRKDERDTSQDEMPKEPKAPESEEDIAPAAPPLRPPSIEKIVGFTYQGGVKPETLENTHIRPGQVDLLVYHHTAMNSDSPFEEVVKEFLVRKGWLTGYHVVVTKDGNIHNLCRWDRFGNHARGFNARSLSVALHGNFEPNPNVPFSNHDGRYGIQHPTSVQLEAAARITAFWSLFYNIKLEFPEESASDSPMGILPHRILAQKACPGGNFPYDQFESLVRSFAREWENSDQFVDAVNRFKSTPMT